MTRKIGIISLGCDKNRVDTETMLFYLSQGGFQITADFDEAQIIVINTCAFIESARKEAIETILEAAQYKKLQCEKLIVTGCLPQKYVGDLKANLPEVDAFLGIADYSHICEIIQKLYSDEPQPKREVPNKEGRIVTTPAHYAYLKIADGCDNHCTFCTIPSIRGKYRSKPIERLFAEAAALCDDGVKELILVAQDVTRYGIDIYDRYALIDLIHELSKLDFLWIRLLYCYPELVTDALIAEIDNNPKLAKYIDIPLQHVDDTVLKRMNRRSTYEGICTLFRKLRATKNSIAIRTTVMVGFPGESEEQFLRLKTFIEQYKPEHVGVFAYSKESDTPSAKLDGQLSKKIKERRVKAIGEAHYQNCICHNRAMIGKSLPVLYENIDYNRNLFQGRTQFNAPEIDTDVFFRAEFADVGNVYPVLITAYDGYDLLGELNQNEFTD